jgi:hypothetical protein
VPTKRIAAALLFFAAPLVAQERIDASAIQRIKDEGMNRSQVMEIASWLTDVYGPRLTGSTNIRKAGNWTVETMRKWGISNPRLESWGEFGRGWDNTRFVAQVTEPTPFTPIGYLGAWSEGTKGRQIGDVVFVEQPTTLAGVDSLKGKVRGKWLMTQAYPESLTTARFTADSRRNTPEDLARMTTAWETYNPTAPIDAGRGGRGGRAGGGGGAGGRAGGANDPEAARMRARVDTAWNTLLRTEGALGIIRYARGGDGTIFIATAAGARRDSAEIRAPKKLPQIYFIQEHYGRIFRTIKKGIPVKLELDAVVQFHDSKAEREGFNVLGEITGSDPALRDQVVMLGGHFDSWHTGTGATDNAAGSATMLEAMRILKTLNLPMKRTVRIGLWGGEEQGLIGSRQYVRRAFGYADSTGAHWTPAHPKFQAYFNVDNGGGAIRGIYLQQNDSVGRVFKQWFDALGDMGPFGINRENTGGTDHQAFDGAGLPGFQFVQDGLDYNTRTHHSNMDLYEKLIPADMKRNATILAAFVYNAANRDGLLPRKPAPTGRGGRGGN